MRKCRILVPRVLNATFMITGKDHHQILGNQVFQLRSTRLIESITITEYRDRCASSMTTLTTIPDCTPNHIRVMSAHEGLIGNITSLLSWYCFIYQGFPCANIQVVYEIHQTDRATTAPRHLASSSPHLSGFPLMEEKRLENAERSLLLSFNPWISSHFRLEPSHPCWCRDRADNQWFARPTQQLSQHHQLFFSSLIS